MSEKKVVRSACINCHGVCQVFVHIEDGRVVKVTGDRQSPTSRGYLCQKGAAAPELLYHPDRLHYPLRRIGKRGENKWKRISWDEALAEMAEKLDTIRRESGAEYFAMMQGTGRPYTGFVARFINAFGSPNLTGVGHICYAPRVIASFRTFGPLPICDIYGFGGKHPECIVIWGCNVTHTGASDGMCGGMLQRALNRAKKVIVVDPRRIAPARKADHWLQIRPGTDGALALAMINVIVSEDLVDHDFVDNYTVGFPQLVDHIREFTPEWAERITRCSAESIRNAARTYAATSPACIQWGNGVDMNMCNFHTARSLLILRGITGNIDRPGGDVNWVAPEGVRMKSPFANPVFAGMHFLPKEQWLKAVDRRKYPLCPVVHPPTFWRSIVDGEPYRIRAIWIMGSNPLLTMSNGLLIEEAMRLLEYVVVTDFFLTPTAQLADLVLPASMWLETNDVVNIHKQWCVLAQQKVAQVGETRDTRDTMIELARRLGHEEQFPWQDYRAFLDWMLEQTGLSFEEFCEKGILTGDMKYFKYRENGFSTSSGKFEIYCERLKKRGVSPLPIYREPVPSPVSTPKLAQEFPLILTTGAEIRYFFQSEGRQIKSLRKRNPDPLVEIHPETARSLGILEGDWVWIETEDGRVRMRAKLFDGIPRDVVSAQHAWWFPEESPPEYGWKKSNANLLFGKMTYDPDTGSESLKCAMCKVYPVDTEADGG
ncbi:MAG: molybdopterin-dependent oxidoreductase [Deltaproteobacteria bacterium]|nr:molybdopterin-dependent oxidoreductase [Deltaproteobacteria bacterium]